MASAWGNLETPGVSSRGKTPTNRRVKPRTHEFTTPGKKAKKPADKVGPLLCLVKVTSRQGRKKEIKTFNEW